MELQKLREVLKQGLVKNCEPLLARCWHELEIAGPDENMEGYKLLGRTEKLLWNNPFLTFDIERHGPTAKGSTYANVYSWEVDVENGTARITESRRRQVHTRAKKLDAGSLAQELVGLIIARTEDPRLVWKENKKVVQVRIDQIVPQTNKQTTSTRRRRFGLILEKRLSTYGWRKVRSNTYQQIIPQNSASEQ